MNANNATALTTLTLDGISYTVIERKTPESCETDGLLNLTAHMREYRQAAHLYLRRPNGKVTFFAVEGEHGGYSTVARLGRW